MLIRLLPLLALPLLAQNNWDTPFPPHRIADNLYYVGSAGLSSYLITSPKGHILINPSFDRTVPIIRASVEKLGFKSYTQDVDTATGKRTRVRVGPFASRQEAEAAAGKLKAAGMQANILSL